MQNEPVSGVSQPDREPIVKRTVAAMDRFAKSPTGQFLFGFITIVGSFAILCGLSILFVGTQTDGAIRVRHETEKLRFKNACLQAYDADICDFEMLKKFGATQ